MSSASGPPLKRLRQSMLSFGSESGSATESSKPSPAVVVNSETSDMMTDISMRTALNIENYTWVKLNMQITATLRIIFVGLPTPKHLVAYCPNLLTMTTFPNLLKCRLCRPRLIGWIELVNWISGSLVDSSPFVRRVVGSNPSLVAT